MQKTSWAQQITYFYTTYPELRATNRSWTLHRIAISPIAQNLVAIRLYSIPARMRKLAK
jgi:hypothetical protein